MKRFIIAIFLTLLVGLSLLYAKVRYDSGLGEPRGDPPTVVGPRSHRATPKMVEVAERMILRDAPSFRAEATDGRSYALADLAKEGPLVLLFIKDGCPCSQAAEPYYNQLHEAYGASVRFFGVIDGNVEVARRWARRNGVPFPILADPDLKVVREYKAENSAYLALIARGGMIEKYWPGYSAPMLREAGERLARLAGLDVKPIDVTDAPETLYSGCPYGLDGPDP